ncbi:hypothetical protein D038_0705B, partial [Vibrio parahaemolyticus IDH02189]
YCIDAI